MASEFDDVMTRLPLLLAVVIALTSCAHYSSQPTSGQKQQLQTIYHGPMRQPTYLYRD